MTTTTKSKSGKAVAAKTAGSKFDFLSAPEAEIKNAPEGRQPEEQQPRRGRPPGKRSNPDFVSTTAYIREKVREAVGLRLHNEDFDFSELVDKLLTDWLDETGWPELTKRKK